MDKIQASIVNCYYIYHSCFILELEDCYMMFDYWKYIQNFEKDDVDFEKLITKINDSGKKIYIFFSHAHSDHFNPQVFEFGFSNAQYILSRDIKKEVNKKEGIVFMKHRDEIKVDDLEIAAFFSTDEGVAFLIKKEQISIFHAGDLHWWAWNSDTEDEAKNMETSFKKTIDIIVEKATKDIDIAFFPVDDRLEENYHLGGEYFIQKLNPKIFIPMHFCEIFKTTKIFKDDFQSKFPNTNIISISKNNEKLI